MNEVKRYFGNVDIKFIPMKRVVNLNKKLIKVLKNWLLIIDNLMGKYLFG